MIEPQLSLALSIHSNPGVYALLFGSGISQSAGVPTGWEIVLDLIRKVAHLRGQECDPDEEGWYRNTFGKAPNYSELLSDVAKSSAERMQLLRSYFEPSEDERENGLKVPTAAHRSAAQLVSKGYIRVILTTNFDRLLEQALADSGIQPSVISTADAANGALPLAHSRCTVVKVNGDYLDTRIKNSPDELANYEEPMNRLLDRVFDEYGLLVCGWSGEWDTALRAAIERCPNRRFSTYWASRGKVSSGAQNLVALRNAIVLEITSADQFLKEVLDNVLALESMAASDVLSPKVAVARMKKFLVDDSQLINLRDLLAAETERVFKAVFSNRFSPHSEVDTSEGILTRMGTYESDLHILLPLLMCGSFWAGAKHDAFILAAFKRIADSHGPERGSVVASTLRRYPALVMLYAMGLAAIANANYRLLSFFTVRFAQSYETQSNLSPAP